jgi:hypothetical protein
MKNSEKVAVIFNTVLLSLAEDLNLHQLEKEDSIYFCVKCLSLQILWYQHCPKFCVWDIKCNTLSLKSENLSGCNEVTRRNLKACASLINRPLSRIYNHSLHTDVYPDSLKISTVKTFFKNDEETSIINSRVLSLLTVFRRYWRKLCTIA